MTIISDRYALCLISLLPRPLSALLAGQRSPGMFRYHSTKPPVCPSSPLLPPAAICHLIAPLSPSVAFSSSHTTLCHHWDRVSPSDPKTHAHKHALLHTRACTHHSQGHDGGTGDSPPSPPQFIKGRNAGIGPTYVHRAGIHWLRLHVHHTSLLTGLLVNNPVT